ncbi:uncharacterized protein LOC135503036 isoform X2 [Lineus longissimus]|uniref:uncharacterized protein LOC135503036 isoform X2 n=1 Tax=Lineus longissimus TaxID=88925 RepID=UPI00315D9200
MWNNGILMLRRSNLNLVRSQCLTTTPLHGSKYITYHQAPTKYSAQNSHQPRVLFFPWLGATKRGILKYVELYHEAGMDVIELHCNSRVGFLWPKSIEKEVLEIIPSIHKMVEETNDTLMVHAASIGAYAYTVFHMEMSSHQEYSHLKDRIVGQVFDSVVAGGLERMASGLATNVSSNTLIQSVIVQTSLLYFGVTKAYTTNFYNKSIEYFHQQIGGRPGSPNLFLHSGNDPMADPESIKNLLHIWRKERDLKVLDKYWPESVHVGHLREHKEDYHKIFKEYMDLVKGGL